MLSRANGPLSATLMAADQGLPVRLLRPLLGDLRRGGVVVSNRGAGGGFRLVRKPEHITLADVIRTIDGSLLKLHGHPPQATTYDGAATHLRDVWIALETSQRAVLENVTLAEVDSGAFSERIIELIRTSNSPSARLQS